MKFSANLSFLYAELPFRDRFAAAARDGFRAVEYVSPYECPAGEIAGLLEANRLEQALFNLPAGNWDAGERGIASDPDRVEEFRAGVDIAIRYASALGCTRVNCLAGIAPPDASRETLDAVLVDNLRYAAPRFADAGVKLLLEPINSVIDIPGFLVDNTRHAARILDAVGSDNLFIQFDFYHVQVMQGDLMRTFAALQDRIGHVQIADHPGRHEPGTGEINYRFVLRELDRLGYDGWVGCEYRPSSGAGADLEWMEELGLTSLATERGLHPTQLR